MEGQKLKADGDSFRLKLNTKDIFDDWARGVQQRNMGVSGRIFTIESTRSRTGRGNVLKLRVNTSYSNNNVFMFNIITFLLIRLIFYLK